MALLGLGLLAFALYRREVSRTRKAYREMRAVRRDRPPDAIATRSSWKIVAPPAARAPLEFTQSYTSDEFQRIQRGSIPRQMEDKWFIYYEEPWLHLHRSWTGFYIFALRFQSSDAGASVVESWVNRDAAQHDGWNLADDRAVARFLVDALLLGKQVPFPVPGDLPADQQGIYKHHVAGRVNRK